VRVLNSANVRVYRNTFFGSPASFERDGRSPEGDHFGWHSSTGPGVDERHGHVFVNNLLVARASFGAPLLTFRQPAALCGSLPEPMADTVDGNLYVRPVLPGESGAMPLVQLSPARTESCLATYESLDAVRRAWTSFEAQGRYLDRTPRSAFRGPDIGRFQPQRAILSAPGAAVPASVRERLGWSEDEARTPGAYASP
jgi:hypothetical protein